MQTTVTWPLSLSNRLRDMTPTDFWEAMQAVRAGLIGDEKGSQMVECAQSQQALHITHYSLSEPRGCGYEFICSMLTQLENLAKYWLDLPQTDPPWPPGPGNRRKNREEWPDSPCKTAPPPASLGTGQPELFTLGTDWKKGHRGVCLGGTGVEGPPDPSAICSLPSPPSKNVDCPFYNCQMAAPRGHRPPSPMWPADLP